MKEKKSQRPQIPKQPQTRIKLCPPRMNWSLPDGSNQEGGISQPSRKKRKRIWIKSEDKNSVLMYLILIKREIF